VLHGTALAAFRLLSRTEHLETRSIAFAGDRQSTLKRLQDKWNHTGAGLSLIKAMI